MTDFRNRDEVVAYVEALTEMVVRLTCALGQPTLDRKRFIGRIRREVIEGALHPIPDDSALGLALLDLDRLLGDAAKAPPEELAALEARYRSRNNPGAPPHFKPRPLKR